MLILNILHVYFYLQEETKQGISEDTKAIKMQSHELRYFKQYPNQRVGKNF